MGAAGLSRGHNHAAVDIADALHPAQRHGHIELTGENVDRRGDAGLAAGAEAVDVGASDHSGPRSTRERAHHVLAGADAAVEHHLDQVAHRLHHLRQRRDRGGRTVELASAVIGDHERAGAHLGGGPGILDVEDALEDELARPEAADPLDVLPTQCRIELTFSIPRTWPARLPKVLRLPRRIDSAQAGLVAISMTLASLICGGTVMPLRISQWRWPSTWRSTVSTSALHFAATARSISARMKPRSFIT